MIYGPYGRDKPQRQNSSLEPKLKLVYIAARILKNKPQYWPRFDPTDKN